MSTVDINSVDSTTSASMFGIFSYKHNVDPSLVNMVWQTMAFVVRIRFYYIYNSIEPHSRLILRDVVDELLIADQYWPEYSLGRSLCRRSVRFVYSIWRIQPSMVDVVYRDGSIQGVKSVIPYSDSVRYVVWAFRDLFSASIITHQYAVKMIEQSARS